MATIKRRLTIKSGEAGYSGKSHEINRRFRTAGLAVIIFSIASAVPLLASAQSAGPFNLRFSSAGIGSATYTYAAGMADMASRELPSGSNIDVVPGAGSLGSLIQLEAGEAELATTHGIVAGDACNGSGLFDGDKQGRIRGVIGGLDIWYYTTFVTKKSGVTTWDDILNAKNGFHLLIVPPGGAGYSASMAVLEAMGSSTDAIGAKGGKVETASRTAVPERIRDGDADGWAHILPAGHPTAAQLVLINDMAVVPLPDDAIAKLAAGTWQKGVIPAGTWKGQDSPVNTVRTGASIITHAGVPDEAIYTFTKTIMENVKKLPQIHAALGDFDPAEAATAIDCPLHPGAEKYYKEAGLL